MKKKLTIYEACQHPEAIAHGLRPPALTHAVVEGKIPAEPGYSKTNKSRVVYFIKEEDLLEFLGAAEVNQTKFINGTGLDIRNDKKKPSVDEETKRKLLKLQLLEEAKAYGVSLLDYLDMIDQRHLADYLTKRFDNEPGTENA